MDNGDFESRAKEEVEWARAYTAVLLAVQLDVAEARAEEAYQRIAGDREEALAASH